MVTLATLHAADPSRDTQKIEIGIDAWTDSIIKLVLHSKKGRQHTKTYPVTFSIESTVIDTIVGFENDGYTAIPLVDEIKKCRVTWMVSPSSTSDGEKMLEILATISRASFDPEPLTIESQVVPCFGLTFAISRIANDCSVTTSFWTNKLTDQQAACLHCFARLKPQMIDGTQIALDSSSTLPATIASMARKATLGDDVDALLEAIGVCYQPINFTKLAQAIAAPMIDF